MTPVVRDDNGRVVMAELREFDEATATVRTRTRPAKRGEGVLAIVDGRLMTGTAMPDYDMGAVL